MKSARRLSELLKEAVDAGASELHLSVGLPPVMRLGNELKPVGDDARLSPEDCHALLSPLLPRPEPVDGSDSPLDLQITRVEPGICRLRAILLRQRGALGGVLKVIPLTPPRLEDLRLPPVLGTAVDARSGLVLVSGPRRSGKSSTLAALVDAVNRRRPAHIWVLGEPVEFFHSNHHALVTHREIGEHTESWAAALRSAAEVDVDVVMIDSIEERQTLVAALELAESGRLVLAGRRGNGGTWQVLSGLTDLFPVYGQETIRHRLGGVLQCLVQQMLVAGVGDTGAVVPAVEVILPTAAIRAMICEDRSLRFIDCVQNGEASGMQTREQALAKLVRDGMISRDTALQSTPYEADLARMLQMRQSGHAGG